MRLTAGTRLGPYAIVAPLGSGGMGEVYTGRDTRIDRIVAIKISNEQFSDRFGREARAAAALNHPHICQLYDVGPNYLVMEYVDGTPLHPVESMPELVSLASQIADGLIAAHAAGIVHRDLKPSNMHVTSSGQVKILDFGLALVKDTPLGVADETRREFLTAEGTPIGTIAYMSPEQARGEVVDARTDLWSLGVVMYELATGVRPFDGPTPAVIFTDVLSQAPVDIRARNPDVPVDLARVIDRLLEKDRELRYQSAADVRADLARIARSREDSRSSDRATVVPRGNVRVRWWMVTAAALAALVAWAAWRFDRGPVTSPSEYVQLTDFPDSVLDPSLSSDGRMVAFIRAGMQFVYRGDVYVKLLPNGDSVRLTNSVAARYGPVFTPDGSRVAYTQVTRTTEGGLTWDTWTVPIGGGEPTRILPNASGLAWLDPQHVLFSKIKGSGLHMGIVTSSTGRTGEREIYYPDHERAMAHYSSRSPDGRSILIVEMDRTSAFQPCRLTPFDGSASGVQVGPRGACTAAAWSPDGRWMYFSATVNGTSHLWRQRAPAGEPEQITFGPTEEVGVALAPDGRSVVTAVGQPRSAVWVHDGRGDRQVSTEGVAFAPRLSADGRRLYYLLRRSSLHATELRLLDLMSGTIDRLVPDQSVSQFDISRDEREVAYTVMTDGGPEVWLAVLDRSTPPRRVVRGGSSVSFGAGSDLLFLSLEDTRNFIARVAKDGSGRSRVSELPVIEKGDSSPDGGWVLAFTPGVGDGTSPRTIAMSTRGGEPKVLCRADNCEGRWSADGKWLYVGGGGIDAFMGLTFGVPLGPDGAPPDAIQAMMLEAAKGNAPPGMRIFKERLVSPGPDPSTYAFVRQDVQRNLFRIPLH